MAKSKLYKAPEYFRGSLATGLAAKASEIEPDGGNFGAGLIPGVAVITRGEALGHDLWIDEDFVASVNEAMAADGAKGTKSRFTHPDMSGDGLAKGLGRVVFRESKDQAVARGDLHIWQSARKSPDGDLGEHILTRAEEDPSSFGASISFLRDLEAEEAFVELNSEEFDFIDRWGEKQKGRRFVSPDPLNVNNYPHARLAKLRAVDIVDDPAANPDGLFCKDETFADAEALVEYVLGFSEEKPELVSLNVDPDRIGSFLDKYLSRRGLEIMSVKLGTRSKREEFNEDAVDEVVETEETNPEPTSEDEVPEPTDGDTDPTVNEGGEEPVVENQEIEDEKAGRETVDASSDGGRSELKRFMTAFGDARGAQWYAEGISFADAQGHFAKALKEENESLRRKLKSAAETEELPLSAGGLDEERRAKAGFGSNLSTPGGKPKK